MKYEVVLKKWLADQRRYQKYSTYTCYANIVENHLLPHLGQLEEVTTDIVQDFAIRLLESGNRVTGQYGINTENTGGSKAHNNLPPYAVVYCWRRTV